MLVGKPGLLRPPITLLSSHVEFHSRRRLTLHLPQLTTTTTTHKSILKHRRHRKTPVRVLSPSFFHIFHHPLKASLIKSLGSRYHPTPTHPPIDRSQGVPNSCEMLPVLTDHRNLHPRVPISRAKLVSPTKCKSCTGIASMFQVIRSYFLSRGNLPSSPTQATHVHFSLLASSRKSKTADHF